MAAEVRQSAKRWVERARDLARETPVAVNDVAEDMRAFGLSHGIIGRLAEAIAELARPLKALLAAWTPEETAAKPRPGAWRNSLKIQFGSGAASAAVAA